MINEMIGRRVRWQYRGAVRFGVVRSVLGQGVDAVYLVAADDGGQAAVPCTSAELAA